MKLSNNLPLEEAIATSTGLFNYPDPEHLEKLFYVALLLFQPTRDKWGKIKVTSGYRSKAVNAQVGGKPTSQHVLGEALDLVPLEADIGAVFEWIINNLNFGQAIMENAGGKEWIHLSMIRYNRTNNEVLAFDGQGYSIYRESSG